MSTTIEEIDSIQRSNGEETEDYGQEFDREYEHDQEYEHEQHEEPTRKTNGRLVEEEVDINKLIVDTLYRKLKDPAIVIALMVVFTNPLLLKIIYNLPYIDVIQNTVSVNFILSILAGIVFFIIRELI